MTTTMYKLEKDLCRCCHAEGAFKHLSDPCFTLGQEEIYSEMLQECLDVKIAPMLGLLSEVTFTICDSCISRLRDACNFKRQVVDCEERFKDMYSKNLIQGFGSAVKEEPDNYPDPENVKLELTNTDEDDDAFLNFDDDDNTEVDEDDAKVMMELESKGKRKGKPIPKPKAKKQPAKKTRTKKDVKKDHSEDSEAAPSAAKNTKGDDAKFTLTKVEDGSKVFTCLTCGSIFKKQNHFSQHYRHVHLKLRPKLRSCYLCDLKVPAHMRAFHLEKVHGWPAPACGACGKKFAYPFQVLKHQKIYHMGEKSHKCDICEMTFASKYRLEQHSIKHTTMRKHRCDFCGKAFRWKNNLKTHIMVHLNDKRHVCPFCNEAFVQQSSLKYHLGKRHPEELY